MVIIQAVACAVNLKQSGKQTQAVSLRDNATRCETFCDLVHPFVITD
jgi:hypothetical protein